MKFRIPLAQPEITDADREAVQAVLRTTTLSTGPKVEEFEQALCAYLGSPFAVTVNSGTSALQLAVEILTLAPGSEVILPSFAFAAPLNVLLHCDLKPVFVDIEADSFNTKTEKIESAITNRTSAILAIHTFGRPLDITAICAIAKRRGVSVIEDACEALGAEIRGRKAGTFGDVGVLAFYPNKQITTGEGGVLLSARQDLDRHARRLRNQGRDSSLDWYQHVEAGYSYRLSDINCALGISQLRRIEAILERRQWLARIYDKRLKALPEILRPSLESTHGRISWFCYVVQLARNFSRQDRDQVCRSLQQQGIGCGRYFAPLHRQPVMSQASMRFDLPVTDFVADRVLALPFYNQMTEAEVEEVVAALGNAIAELRRNS